ncbi:cupin domain-containing protein [Defluviimonas sp. SAOS-178_SWC]|uniref:cupin domain-containing protein n=1 Tax=Defluviimonas sp. SAOS-178_SWC TaxID=3121287 RepID=UPI0032220F1C
MTEPAGHFGGLKSTDIVPFAGRNYAVQMAIVPPGGGGHSHHHETLDQIFYIVGGQLTFTVGDETFELKTGQSVLLEPMDPHGTLNEGASDTTVLVVTIEQDERKGGGK